MGGRGRGLDPRVAGQVGGGQGPAAGQGGQQRRRFRGPLLTDGSLVTWEYPGGDQMDIVEVMEIQDGLIAAHRVYWGWLGVGMLLRDQHGR